MKQVDEYMKILGKQIKQLRLHQDIPQEILVKAAGIPRANLQRLENGQNVTIKTLILVLNELNKLDWLEQITLNELLSDRDRATHRKRQHLDLEHKRYSLMQLYNLSLEDYIFMFDCQNGKCGNLGCNSKLDLMSPETHVDHCHETGKVRSLLCAGCNSALGMVKENQNRLKGLSDYVDLHTDFKHPIDSV